MMDAVSLWQPWATLMIVPDPINAGHPPKEWETRPYAPPAKVLDRRIALASTASIDTSVRNGLIIRGRFREPYASILERCGISVLDPWVPGYVDKIGPREIPLVLGAVVGSAIVIEARATEYAGPWISAGKAMRREARRDEAVSTEIALGDYTPGRHAWRMGRPVRLLPSAPVKGFQRIWTLPADVERLVLRSVARTSPAIASVLAGQ